MRISDSLKEWLTYIFETTINALSEEYKPQHRDRYPRDWAYGLTSLSEKTRRSNHLQILEKGQHLLNYFKTLSVGNAGNRTRASRTMFGAAQKKERNDYDFEFVLMCKPRCYINDLCDHQTSFSNKDTRTQIIPEDSNV